MYVLFVLYVCMYKHACTLLSIYLLLVVIAADPDRPGISLRHSLPGGHTGPPERPPEQEETQHGHMQVPGARRGR